MDNLPVYIPLCFVLTTMLTLLLFLRVVHRSNQKQHTRKVGVLIFAFLFFNAAVAINGFYYSNLDAMPPRLMLFGAFPVLFLMIVMFLTKKGKSFIDGLSFFDLTLVSLVRIPVEFCLYWLALHHVVPELMSFAGRNFDIVAGITAPFVAYYGIKNNAIKRPILWIWNIVGVLLLLQIIVSAVLSTPFPMQQLAFEQPNIAILHFPFVWLPTFVAPLVLFTHFISIRKLLIS